MALAKRCTFSVHFLFDTTIYMHTYHTPTHHTRTPHTHTYCSKKDVLRVQNDKLSTEKTNKNKTKNKNKKQKPKQFWAHSTIRMTREIFRFAG